MKTYPLLDIHRLIQEEWKLPQFAQDIAYNGIQAGLKTQLISHLFSAVDIHPLLLKSVSIPPESCLFVHHGLFFGKSEPQEAWLDMLSFLSYHHICLYAVHLPVDAHPRLGNNALLAEYFVDKKTVEPFFLWNPSPASEVYIGCKVTLEKTHPIEQIKEIYSSFTVRDIHPSLSANQEITQVAILSGKASMSDVKTCAASGVDLLITGEIDHPTALLALSYEIPVLTLGHYDSETLGIQALGEYVSQVLHLPHQFLSFPLKS